MKFFQGSLFLLLAQNVSAFAPTSNKSPFIQLGAAQQSKQSQRLENTQLFDLEKLQQYTPGDEETRGLLDEYGEKSRQYRRNVFSASDWVYSRRPDRIVSNLSTTFDSGLVRQLSFELSFLLFSSSFIVAWNDLFVKGWLDFGGMPHEPLADFIPGLILPLAPFSLSISALALLLTFRTNTSYARWNEARTAWGKIINDSRSIARMGCTWGKSYKNITSEMVQRLGEAILSFSRSVMNRTLPPQEDEENFQEYTHTRLTDADYAERLRNAKHRPTTALAEITNCLVDMELNPLHQVEVEKTVTGLCDALGACERIFTSPVPTFYPRHTARFLALWLLALPTGLYEAFGNSWNHIGVIPVTLIVSGFLLGIEELSTQMEEPFSILPMEKMCEGSIRTSVMEQVERSKEGIQAKFKGYEMFKFPQQSAPSAMSMQEYAPEVNNNFSNDIVEPEEVMFALTDVDFDQLDSRDCDPSVQTNYLESLKRDSLHRTSLSGTSSMQGNYMDSLNKEPLELTSFSNEVDETGSPSFQDNFMDQSQESFDEPTSFSEEIDSRVSFLKTQDVSMEFSDDSEMQPADFTMNEESFLSEESMNQPAAFDEDSSSSTFDTENIEKQQTTNPKDLYISYPRLSQFGI